jgi:amino acid transporter
LGANVFLIFFQGEPEVTRCHESHHSLSIGYTAFLNPFNATDFVVNYILLPVFVIFFLVWKFWHKTKLVKLEEMDIWSGRRDIDAERPEKPKPTVLHRIKNVVIG